MEKYTITSERSRSERAEMLSAYAGAAGVAGLTRLMDDLQMRPVQSQQSKYLPPFYVKLSGGYMFAGKNNRKRTKGRVKAASK